MGVMPRNLPNLSRLLLALLALGCATAVAASPGEEQAYKAATQGIVRSLIVRDTLPIVLGAKTKAG